MTSTSSERDLDPAVLAATVTSLTHSFGDPTRRKIFFFLRERSGATATEIAEHCCVHPNVVRHHLEKLREGGYVAYDNVRRTTVGRPAKGYHLVEGVNDLLTTSRRDALVVALLERALERLGPDEAELTAHEVGLEYGRALAATQSPHDQNRSSMHAAMASIAGLLTAHGFDAHAEQDEAKSSVVSDNCPFGNAAQHHPVLCAVDRGLISGMLESLGVEGATITLRSRARGDDSCRVTA